MACSKVSISSTINLGMHELIHPSTSLEMSKKPSGSRTTTQKITAPSSLAHLTSMTRRCMRCICGLLRMLSMPVLPVSVSHITYFNDISKLTGQQCVRTSVSTTAIRAKTAKS